MDKNTFFKWLKVWRFEVLLVVLLASFALAPFFDHGAVLGIFASIVLIASVATVSEGTAFNRVSWCLAVASLIALWVAELTARTGLVLVSNVCDVLFFLLVLWALLSHIFRATEVTHDILAGAICCYLLMGLGWTNLYIAIENLEPGSFSSGALAVNVPGGLTSVHEQQSHFNYFSLVTLSTLGYGDITPVSRSARHLAALEAIVGQLFIGVLIARLVGQRVKSSRPTTSDPDHQP